MIAATTPKMGFGWRTGGLVAALFILILAAWNFWSRAPLAAMGLGALLGAVGIYLSPLAGVALFGFMVMSGINEFVGGLSSPLLLWLIVTVLLRKLLTGDATWRWTPVTWMTILFFAWLQFTGLWAKHLDYYQWNYSYRAVLLILAVSEIVDSPKQMVVVLVAMLLGVCFTCGYVIKSFAAFYTTGVAEKVAESSSHIDKTRFAGHWPDANYLATALLCMLGPSIALWQSRMPSVLRLLSLTTGLLICVTVVFTLSRAGMIVTLAVLILMIAVQKRRMLIGTGFALLIIAVMVFAPMDAAGRLMTLVSGGDASTGARGQLLIGALKVFLENPLFGSGLDTFRIQITNIFQHFQWPTIAHNTYADVAAESGIIGIAFFLILFVQIGRCINWRDWAPADGDFARGLNQGLRASFIGVLLSMATLSAYSFAPYWMVLVLASILPFMSRSGQEIKPSPRA